MLHGVPILSQMFLCDLQTLIHYLFIFSSTLTFKHVQIIAESLCTKIVSLYFLFKRNILQFVQVRSFEYFDEQPHFYCKEELSL